MGGPSRTVSGPRSAPEGSASLPAVRPSPSAAIAGKPARACPRSLHFAQARSARPGLSRPARRQGDAMATRRRTRITVVTGTAVAALALSALPAWAGSGPTAQVDVWPPDPAPTFAESPVVRPTHPVDATHHMRPRARRRHVARRAVAHRARIVERHEPRHDAGQGIDHAVLDEEAKAPGRTGRAGHDARGRSGSRPAHIRSEHRRRRAGVLALPRDRVAEICVRVGILREGEPKHEGQNRDLSAHGPTLARSAPHRYVTRSRSGASAA